MTILEELRARSDTRTPSRALRYLPATAFLVDLIIIVTCVSAAVIGRSRWQIFEVDTRVDEFVGIFAIVTVLLWMAINLGFGAYATSVFVAGPDEYKRITRATLFTFGFLGVACFLAKFPLARGFYVLAFAFGLPAIVLGRLLLRRTVHRAHRRGHLLSRVLIAGSATHIDEIAGVLRRESWLGYDLLGALTPAGSEPTTHGGVPVIGTTDEILCQVEALKPDIVFFAGGAVKTSEDLRRLAYELAKADVQLVVAPSVTDVSSDRVRIRPVGGLPLIHVDPPRASGISQVAKRLFDIVGSFLAIVVFSPILLGIALWVRRDDGPALFRQTRVGKGGGEFACLKFRSMVTNAEELLADLHAAAGYERGLFKMHDDPRITGAGRFLRKYSLDELPQLFNVLRGEMSLVGPRPPLPAEVAQYEKHVERRLDVRPGLTGLWQVSGRSDLTWEEAVRLDLYYVDNWSMLQDLNIIAKTVRVVLTSDGAY
ncbi:sugar transferase [Nocardioides salsibiostraticola]